MSLQVISRVKNARLGFTLRLRDLMRLATAEAYRRNHFVQTMHQYAPLIESAP